MGDTKRIAFVGLSGPIFYDYNNQATRAASDLIDSPNPVLDSPFGLMLLFDEVWFLCRSLCPENLRGASFVKFVDETSLLPKTDDIPAVTDLSEGIPPEVRDAY